MPLGFYRVNSLAKAVAAAGRDALTITAFNDAQVDTAQSKFGGASALFDGTDYLEIDNTGEELDLGSGDWTIEFWMYPTVIPGGGDYDFIYDSRITGSGTQPSIGLTSSKVFFFTAGGFRITGATTITANNWYHVALVKNGSTTTLYLGGSSDGTYSDSNTYTAADAINIGLNFNEVNGYTGNIDELRISSVARYTGSFTPSASAFSNDSDTLVLIHCDGADASTTFTDDNS